MNNFFKNALLGVFFLSGIYLSVPLQAMEKEEFLERQYIQVKNMTGYPINISYQQDSSTPVKNIKVSEKAESYVINLPKTINFMRIYFESVSNVTAQSSYGGYGLSYYMPFQSIDVTSNDISLLNRPQSIDEKRILTVTYSYKQIGYTLHFEQGSPVEKAREKETPQVTIYPSLRDNFENIIEEYNPEEEISIKEYSPNEPVSPLMGESVIIFKPDQGETGTLGTARKELAAKLVATITSFLTGLIAGKETFWIKSKGGKTLVPLSLKTTDKKKTTKLLQEAIDTLNQQGYTQESLAHITNLIDHIPFKTDTKKDQYYAAKIKELIKRRFYPSAEDYSLLFKGASLPKI